MTGPSAVTSTYASLDRARARQQTIVGRLRPLSVAVVAVTLVLGSFVHPRPDFHGVGLGVLLAMVGLTAGALGVVRPRQVAAAAQAPFFALLITGSAVLGWLQPDGPGFLGDFVAAVTAATRLRGRAGAVAAAAAAASLTITAAGTDHPLTTSILTGLGAGAMYLLGVLANQLREGQDQAEQLVRELERTRAAQAEAAILAERQRLAREMHDVLAHTLAGMALQLEGARLLCARTNADPQLAQVVVDAHHLARTGLQEARRAIGMLRDDEIPTPDRLAALAREFACDTGVPCEFNATGAAGEIGPRARLTLYRTAQEALTNTRKHANPTRVSLVLAYEPAGLRLTIEDFRRPDATRVSGDRGPSGPADHAPPGYGLTGMRERAELLDGTLSAAPTADGFRVELWIPT